MVILHTLCTHLCLDQLTSQAYDTDITSMVSIHRHYIANLNFELRRSSIEPFSVGLESHFYHVKSRLSSGQSYAFQPVKYSQRTASAYATISVALAPSWCTVRSISAIATTHAP
jgi:hypothetical protein